MFLFDSLVGTLTRVSVASGGGQSDLPSLAPASATTAHHRVRLGVALLSADPDTVACESRPPACLRPFVVDRQAGTTRRVPAPAIVTSQVVDSPGGPLVITYRDRGRGVFVAPDGTSIAVNASSIASVITNSTGYDIEELDLPPDARPGPQHDVRRALRELGRPPLHLQQVRRRAT